MIHIFFPNTYIYFPDTYILNFMLLVRIYVICHQEKKVYGYCDDCLNGQRSESDIKNKMAAETERKNR